MYCFFFTSGLLIPNCYVRLPNPKICSVLLVRVTKADTLPFDQTNKAEDFRILTRKHLPFTTSSLNLHITTLLKSDILGATDLHRVRAHNQLRNYQELIFRYRYSWHKHNCILQHIQYRQQNRKTAQTSDFISVQRKFLTGFGNSAHHLPL